MNSEPLTVAERRERSEIAARIGFLRGVIEGAMCQVDAGLRERLQAALDRDAERESVEWLKF